MGLGKIAALWHKHDYRNDRGYDSLEAKFFDEFCQAEQHLKKQSRDGSDFKNFIAIESTYPIFLDSVDDCNWVSLPSLAVKEDYIRKLLSIGFQMNRENLTSIN